MSEKKMKIIFKETGGTDWWRIYSMSADSKIVNTHIVKGGSVRNWFTRIFLPVGYPQSVSQDYLAYQTWDTAQAFCSTISGILATQEVLRGVGVGDMNATVLAATITWVLKDGCGHIGRILFAYTHGKYLDAYSKTWRLYADILNNLAMFIEITLPYYGDFSVFAICTSTMMKSIVGVAGGATRIAMTQHHALTGNFADVSAKDAAQETAVNLVASLVSLLIIGYIGSPMLMFMLMAALHIAFNYLAVRAVCLKTLNEPRFLLVIEQFLKHNTIATPAVINKIEPLLSYQIDTHLLNFHKYGIKIKLGSSIKDATMNMDGGRLMALRYMYSERAYVLAVDISQRTIHVLIKQNVTADAVLCAYFHAVLLAHMTSSLNCEPYAMFRIQDSVLADFLHKNTNPVQRNKTGCDTPNSDFLIHPSDELHSYLTEKMSREWPPLLDSIIKAGWDVSRHLLVMDRWRITDQTSPYELYAKKKTF